MAEAPDSGKITARMLADFEVWVEDKSTERKLYDAAGIKDAAIQHAQALGLKDGESITLSVRNLEDDHVYERTVTLQIIKRWDVRVGS